MKELVILFLDLLSGLRSIEISITDIIYVYGLKKKRSTKFFYIGITNSIVKRKQQHLLEAKNGTHKNKALQEILRKNSDIELVVIDRVSEKNALKKEKEYISKYLKEKHPLVNIKR